MNIQTVVSSLPHLESSVFFFLSTSSLVILIFNSKDEWSDVFPDVHVTSGEGVISHRITLPDGRERYEGRIRKLGGSGDKSDQISFTVESYRLCICCVFRCISEDSWYGHFCQGYVSHVIVAIMFQNILSIHSVILMFSLLFTVVSVPFISPLHPAIDSFHPIPSFHLIRSDVSRLRLLPLILSSVDHPALFTFYSISYGYLLSSQLLFPLLLLA